MNKPKIIVIRNDNIPKVVRIRRKDGKIVQDCDIYIGRRLTQGGWNLMDLASQDPLGIHALHEFIKDSKWANPFKLKDYNNDRNVILSLYRNYVLNNPDLMNSLLVHASHERLMNFA